MTKDIRNGRIATHLAKRFKDRHGVELTRERRLMLLKQIDNGVGKFLFMFPNRDRIYRVLLYSNDLKMNVAYSVIYSTKLNQIMTVLPSKDSDEYSTFLKKKKLSRESVEDREMTGEERTEKHVSYLFKNRAEAERKAQEKITAAKKMKDGLIAAEREAKIQAGLRRLRSYNSSQKYLRASQPMPEEVC